MENLGSDDAQNSYETYVEHTKETRDAETAVQYAIGGNFDAYGTIEAEMLKLFGLTPASFLIDVGCGSGRLAAKLGSYLTGRYLGTDVVQALLDHAKSLVPSDARWHFERVDTFTIPAMDKEADMVCFFSVFTHLLHEQAFLYLEEAKRVLKPGGKIVFSFLEFRMESHWAVFDATVRDARTASGHPLNVFFDRDAIAAWARMLGLKIEQFRDGVHDFVPIPSPLTLDSGEIVQGASRLGQSICVLTY